MKRWLWWLIVAVIIGVLFIGFGYTKKNETAKYYRSEIRDGKVELKKAHYKKAEISFQNALKRKSNAPEAKAMLKQTKTYRSGLAMVTQRDYAGARRAFNKVASIDKGYELMVKRSRDNSAELKKVIKRRGQLNKFYKQAQIMTSNYEYSASNDSLALIIDSRQSKSRYYEDIRHKALALKQKNNDALRALGYTVSDSSSDYSDIAPGSDKDEARNKRLAKKITRKQIKSARKVLDKQGVDSSAFTDQDIRAVIVQAKNEHKTVKQVAREFR